MAIRSYEIDLFCNRPFAIGPGDLRGTYFTADDPSGGTGAQQTAEQIAAAAEKKRAAKMQDAYDAWRNGERVSTAEFRYGRYHPYGN